MNTPTPSGSDRPVDDQAPLPTLTLPALLDLLDAMGVTFRLAPAPGSPHPLAFDPPLNPEATELLRPWLVMLTYVAMGRYTRHAPALCQGCAMVSMAKVTQRRGADPGEPSSWSTKTTCPACHHPRLVTHAPLMVRRKRARRLTLVPPLSSP